MDTDTGQETESISDTDSDSKAASDTEHQPHDTPSEVDSTWEIETETNHRSSDDTVLIGATDNDSDTLSNTDTSALSTDTQSDTVTDTDTPYSDDSEWDTSTRPQDTSKPLDTHDMVVTPDGGDENEPAPGEKTEQGQKTLAEIDSSTELALLESLANSGPFEPPDFGCGCDQVGHTKPKPSLLRLLTGI